ncbi:MAG: DUF1801 domain-containing protein [Gammaproteobacteria bacterium]|nr:DUF1801 domain-containing protein [Gammaproteobacteria bacterium]
MAENKTRPTQVSAKAFLKAVDNERRRADGEELLQLMQDVSGERPVMWGPTIIGFGQYRYRYDTGREGDSPIVGFSPRKSSLVLYLGSALEDDKLMAKLGKHKRGRGCLYINKLDDVDRKVLRKLVEKSVADTRKRIAAT